MIIKEKKEAFAYGSIIEALSFGLYPEKEHVIREFIQNSFDAIEEFRRLGLREQLSPIEVRVEPPSIFIANKGIGMNKTMVNQFRYIGYSEKKHGKTAGFRGIGKDSGFAVAEKIIVTTSRYGDNKRFQVIIDAKEMLNEINKTRNPPLDNLLEKHSRIEEYEENVNRHFSVVELYGIRSDAKTLFDNIKLQEYIEKNAPLPFNPAFKYANKIETQLKANIDDFLSVDLWFNGTPLYKNYLENATEPDFDEIFFCDEENSPLVAYCWYCQNKEKGQFSEKDKSGLVFRVKNFAVGDRHLTRKELWETTPERAFHFFGEIHVLDPNVIPSSDRSNFEDSDARLNLYARCKRIAQVLSRKAGIESEIRRFEEVTEKADHLVTEKGELIKRGEIPKELKPDLEFSVKKVLEEVQKRIKRSQVKKNVDPRENHLVKEAAVVVRKARRLINQIENGSNTSFVDVEKALKFNKQTKKVYKIIIDCLREVYEEDLSNFQIIVGKIHDALKKKLS